MRIRNLPDYEKEYRISKVRFWLAKAVIVLLPPVFCMTVLRHLMEGASLGEKIGSILACYVLFHLMGLIPFRFWLRRKKKLLKSAYCKKLVYESLGSVSDDFVYAPEEGFDRRMLQSTGILMQDFGQNIVGDFFQFAMERLPVFGDYMPNLNANNEYMSGVYNGIRYERANVDLMHGTARRFVVNWMVLDLPCDTMTNLVYLSGSFLQNARDNGFAARLLRNDSNCGSLFSLGGEEPSDYLSQSLMRLAQVLGNDFEIAVQGGKLHVLVRREGYAENLLEFAKRMKDDKIERQVYGRAEELTRLIDSLPMAFPKGMTDELMYKKPVGSNSYQSQSRTGVPIC